MATVARGSWTPTVAQPPEIPAGNLPHEVNAFVGRLNELAQLRDAQLESRMLTLVGPGGVGKTRLGLRLASQLQDAFPDGVWLVDLTPVTDPALVPQLVGDVLGVRQQPGQPWSGELTRVLRSRRALLVLDNCEHLVEACAELVDELLRTCLTLHILATSQQPLGAAGEWTWRVPPLALPEASTNGAQALQASEAAQLFLARTRATLPTFTLGEQNAAPVAEICRQLDGLPLALELVAARVAALGLGEVATRLSDRFALAVGASRGAPTRQRTLQAALEWSYGLLDADERTVLRRLAVFVGGWTLEAARTVCGDDMLPVERIVEVLERLVAKSLVVADHSQLTVRYRLLETVHAYALSQLTAAGEAMALRHRHAEFMLQLAEHVPPESLSSSQAALLKPEEGNVRAALEWAGQDEVELGLRLAAAAFPLWWFTGHYLEGVTWLDRLLALRTASVASPARAMALRWSGQLRLMLGELARAEQAAQTALEEHQALGDAQGAALALIVQGNAAMLRADFERARGLHSRSVQALRDCGNSDRAMAVSLTQLGLLASELGETERVAELAAELEAIDQMLHEPIPRGRA
ncbi:MAG: AAA family ATPase, partial [Chloroflexi bacterium]|nr:AAA family ATPase [Chloroflexota bacterium]